MSAAPEDQAAPWIVAVEDSPDTQHFGPFVDEDAALAWGFDNLADYEPEDWEPYELSLTPPGTGGDAR